MRYSLYPPRDLTMLRVLVLTVWPMLGVYNMSVMACRLFGTKPLPEPMLAVCQVDYYEQTPVKYNRKSNIFIEHYSDVIMSSMASQITSITIVYSTVYSGTDQRKYQSSASLAFVWGIHRWSVNSPHTRPVTRKMFPFDNVIMKMHLKMSSAIFPQNCTGEMC